MAAKILVVDDEPDLEALVRQRFRRQIRDGHYDFVFARNGAEALDRLDEDPDIEVMLTDINMPVMDGLTLLAQLQERSATIQPVMVSAYGDIHNFRQAMNRGAFDFLTKPIDFQDFENTIVKALAQVRARKEAATNQVQLVSLQAELRLAARIQQAILPRGFPPWLSPDDLDLAGLVVPAQKVSGDFYDYFPLDGERLGVVIGSVSGRGIPGAIFMASCRALFRAVALWGDEPGLCLRKADSLLCRDRGPDLFLRLFYGILHVHTGAFQYSSGGHVPPFLHTAAGLRLLDDPGGSVLGVAEDIDAFPSHVVRLAPGDLLFLYTDGLPAVANAAGEAVGAGRLEPCLLHRGRGSAADVVAQVIQCARDHAGATPIKHDLTALAVRFLGGRAAGA